MRWARLKGRPHTCKKRARELGERTTLVDWSYRWHLAQARLAEAEGNLEGALADLDEAKRLYVKNPVPDLRPVEALKARLHLKQGCLPQAQAWARDRGLAATDALSYLREFEHLTLARVLIAENQAGQGDHLLDSACCSLRGRPTPAGNALESPGRAGAGLPGAGPPRRVRRPRARPGAGPARRLRPHLCG